MKKAETMNSAFPPRGWGEKNNIKIMKLHEERVGRRLSMCCANGQLKNLALQHGIKESHVLLIALTFIPLSIFQDIQEERVGWHRSISARHGVPTHCGELNSGCKRFFRTRYWPTKCTRSGATHNPKNRKIPWLGDNSILISIKKSSLFWVLVYNVLIN